MLGTIIGIVGKIAGSVADRIFPNPEHELKRLELQRVLQAAVLERTSEIERAAAEVLKLWDIVEIGLGGYVIGRTSVFVAPGALATSSSLEAHSSRIVKNSVTFPTISRASSSLSLRP